jgi:pimeloyl-ACP methyl ester carboxylesterase
MMRCWFVLFLMATTSPAFAQANDAKAGGRCGEARSVTTQSGATMRYALAEARGDAASGARSALVMLIGGGGFIALDDKGCPQKLNGNSLIRMSPLLREAGVATVLVDVPSDLRGEEGLGGFRIASGHAEDLGKVIAELRSRIQGPVWIIGHSRGTISAANAAARLTGSSAPDGVVLLSPMLVGDARAKKSWVAQTVFSVDLEAIKAPLLIVGHAADNCVRSPADRMGNVAAKTLAARRQVATMTGGPVSPGRAPGVAACEVGEPHDFVDQEAEVAAGIVRFMRGGSY